ncbi:MAG TPA: XdhC family protein [Acidimicrobiia bacterium]|nr:XdhC family protein [Acidimicrobiia bacterium]
MRAALETCRQWEAEGKRVAAATVVAVAGSTPRREGARLLVSSTGDTWGSVSNGCVEGDVAAHAAEVLRTGRPHLAAYGITDEFAFDVGLSCGGSIEVFIEPWAGLAERLAGGLGEGFVGAVATVMDGSGQGAHGLFDRERGWVAGDLPASLAELLAPAAAAAVDAEHSHILPVGESRVFVQAVTPVPRLLLFGAGHTAEALAPMAAAAGFRVFICDPRPALAVPERYPAAVEVLVGWPDRLVPMVAPDRRTYAVLLAHDPKIEVPLLPLLLATPARYIGVLGSRKTQADRVARLTAGGWAAEQVARLVGPVGLDIGAVTPEEVAVSIVAQMVAVRRGEPVGGKTAAG